MSHTKKRLMTTGAVMVALSSFVPNPLLTGEAFAQASTSTTLTASATVVNPLGLTPGQLIKMGKFAVKGAGKLGLTVLGAQSAISNVLALGGATTQQGTVKITAPKSAAFKISIPTFATGPIKLVQTAGGKTAGTATAKTLVSITQLKIPAFATGVPAAAKTFSTGNVSTTASNTGATFEVVNLGATLSFHATQTPGVYRGTYKVLTTY